jgi:hypothetical protein
VKRTTATVLAALPLLLASCGTSSSSSRGATHVMPDGRVMSGSAMPGMDPSSDDDMDVHGHGEGASGPSATASMICGDEIRDAVGHNLAVRRAPAGLHSWQARTFSCTYQLAGGDLRLSVKDLDSAKPGRVYFDSLRAGLPRPRTIQGLANLGFPAFETTHGDVVFIKDHKTLWVDASRLADSDLPRGRSREDVAYGVAAAVIACWTE